MTRGGIKSARRRWIWMVTPGVIFLAVAAGWSLTSSQQPDEFCELWGVLTDSPLVSYGDITLLVGDPIRNRDPCNGDDLAHYASTDLIGVDGVLFDNCEVSWVGGGRSTAAAEGIECDPVPTTQPGSPDP